jgi:hypothetical protein
VLSWNSKLFKISGLHFTLDAVDVVPRNLTGELPACRNTILITQALFKGHRHEVSSSTEMTVIATNHRSSQTGGYDTTSDLER